ncbi:MAG: EamA family transporter RarD [Anaerolineaceae bacterium]|nr:MAG: EamA family transporter RarD [Chloroflexi bacterium HGW-Chloroflexi-8]
MKKGIISVLIAYAMWGFFPIYFKFLHAVPATQIMAHRVSWSFVFLSLMIIFTGKIKDLLKNMNKKVMLLYFCAGVIISINWLTYVWGVNAGYVIETSLGYFINPLVSVLLGVIILKERLRPLQWVPVILAAIGVTYITIQHGSLPWIAMVLAVTFGTYGLLKKIAPLQATQGLTLETGGVFIPALGYLLFCEFTGTGAYGHINLPTTLLLTATGIITAVPLLFFAAGAPKVPLTTIGLLQYIAPTIQFLIGVFIYREPFSTDQLIGFGIIWLALIIFSLESYSTNHKTMKLVHQEHT